MAIPLCSPPRPHLIESPGVACEEDGLASALPLQPPAWPEVAAAQSFCSCLCFSLLNLAQQSQSQEETLFGFSFQYALLYVFFFSTEQR